MVLCCAVGTDVLCAATSMHTRAGSAPAIVRIAVPDVRINQRGDVVIKERPGDGEDPFAPSPGGKDGKIVVKVRCYNMVLTLVSRLVHRLRCGIWRSMTTASWQRWTRTHRCVVCGERRCSR